MKSNWKKNLFKGLCLTSVAFVFQACYGTPQDLGYDLLIEGKVMADNKLQITFEDLKAHTADLIKKQMAQFGQ